MSENITFIDPAAIFSRERLAGYTPEMLDTRLLILGAGALGSALAMQLSMWGFRRVTVVDFDDYEISNATRVFDFPHRAVARGERVNKASHLAATLRRRIRGLCMQPFEIASVNGYAQELAPSIWRSADVVLGAVDHPRARFDCARIARRYGRPFLSGGFDGEQATVTVRFFPGSSESACARCTHSVVPEYACASASCQAEGRRALEARKLPATPSLAGFCASWMIQRLVDGLRDGWPSFAERRETRLRGAPGVSLAEASLVTRSPTCPDHPDMPPLPVALKGQNLGAFLHSLETALPGAALVPLAPFVVHVPSLKGLHVARVPAWRLHHAALDHLPIAPEGAYPLAFDELTYAAAKRHGLTSLPLQRLGLGPGARFEVSGVDRRLREWARPA